MLKQKKQFWVEPRDAARGKRHETTSRDVAVFLQSHPRGGSNCEIWGSHGGQCGLAACDAVWTCRQILTFRRNTLPPSSWPNCILRYTTEDWHLQEFITTRLRIGHTRLTHGHSLRDEKHRCEPYFSRLSVLWIQSTPLQLQGSMRDTLRDDMSVCEVFASLNSTGLTD
jgi:hypothetical protein